MKEIDEAVMSAIKTAYDAAPLRFFFLDYDGTLVPFAEDPSMALPGEETTALLAKAASVPGNRIHIISGRNKQFLDSIFDGMNITLVAEHGFFTRQPGGEWAAAGARYGSWKIGARTLLESYVARFPGSLIEEKESSLAWHFRKCKNPPASRQLIELRRLLQREIKGSDTSLLRGNMVLEIKDALVDKGLAARNLLRDQDPGFILAAGDDLTDEDLFRAMPGHAFTIKVGNGDSAARYFCKGQPEVASLLRLLTGPAR